MQAIRLSTRGEWCENCSILVEKAVSGIPGVVRVAHDHVAETADVVFDEAQVDRERVLEALRHAGFGSELGE